LVQFHHEFFVPWLLAVLSKGRLILEEAIEKLKEVLDIVRVGAFHQIVYESDDFDLLSVGKVVEILVFLDLLKVSKRETQYLLTNHFLCHSSLELVMSQFI